ncbi:hypothetical protein [Klebsiella pneumoniae]|nr:MAG TPA: hypothetical protein [Caudoviricetes sp.]
MTQIKQLLRPSYGWYNSVSKKDKWFLDDVQIPMYVARKLIRKARMVESNHVRKVWEM